VSRPPSKSEPGTEARSGSERSFEEALAELEGVVRDLEDGRLGLNDSLGRYEEGVRLLRFCHAALDQAERRIMLLTGVDESGAATTRPFDDDSLSLEEKKEQRSRRRSSSGPVRGGAGGERSAASPADDLPDGGSQQADPDEVDRRRGLF
jgi:exodeoxyribonuclease VII small subunit